MMMAQQSLQFRLDTFYTNPFWQLNFPPTLKIGYSHAQTREEWDGNRRKKEEEEPIMSGAKNTVWYKQMQRPYSWNDFVNYEMCICFWKTPCT